ncbi:tetratricopeptide repeat protein [Bacillus cereus]|uniref:tetratricopeptide repeat protein n=1 Tax=Bacillus cereus TaxID=1396 RepID=UPI0014444086|nr:hypothetical protein [Bacillus cereus]NKX61466.1 hypothetical protein [Bacillus cereus]
MYKTKNVDVIKNLKKSRNLKRDIEFYKCNAPFSEIGNIFEEIYRISYYRLTLIGKAFPKRIDQYKKKSTIYPSDDVQRELIWTSKIISKYVDEINCFLKKKEDYIKSLFLSDFQRAKEILDSIEEEFGLSCWLLENRIALLQSMEGLEKQKEYTQNIIENDKANVILRFLLRFYSIKAESNVSPEKYNQEIYKAYEEFDDNSYDDPFYSYLKFKINIANIDDFDYRCIILIENELSIIDRYMTFVEIILNLAVSNSIDLYSETIQEITKNISHINDSSFHNFWGLLYESKTIYIENKNSLILEIMDSYTKGLYAEVIEKSEGLLSGNPDIVEIYEVYVKSLLYLNSSEMYFKNNLLGDIISNLKDIYTNNNLAEESLVDLIKICYIYSKDTWSRKLRSLALNSYYGTRKASKNMFAAVGSITSFLSKPQVLNNLYEDKNILEKLIDNLLLLNPSSETLILQKAFLNSNMDTIEKLPIPNGRKRKFLAEIHNKNKEYELAIQMFEKLLNVDTTINKLEIVTGIINSYIELDKLEKAVEIAVDYYFENKNILNKIEVSELLNRIEQTNVSRDNICLPILYDLYAKHLNSDKDGIRNDLYEDFLESCGISRASELDFIKDFTVDKKWIYFLRYICIPNIMANSIEFDTLVEVESERLIICQMLRDLDQENEEIYSNEIKTITQKQMVRKGIREIENSKIYVDVDGIKSTLEKNLKENFNRYKSFGFDNINHSKPKYILLDKELTIMVPSNEKLNLFSSMVIELRDSFVSSKEYGLDGYLSVGIRHGTLSGQLRGQIENEKLITQLDSNTQNYHANNYWLERVGTTDFIIKEFLLEKLNDFSQNIDELINKLKNELIQINIDNSKNENGLFDYIITTDDLEYLYNIIDEDTSYSEFVDIIIDYLWQRTEENLKSIRHYLEGNFKIDLNVCFEKLQYDIDSIKDKANIVDLNNSIVTAKTSMQYEVDKISSWFSRGKVSERSDYSISLPIEIGLEMAKNIYKNEKNYEIISKNIDDIILDGKSFKSLVDVSFIIFENIFKHSGLGDSQKIEINCTKKDSKILFKCINKVRKIENIDELNRNLKQKQQNLKSENGLEMVNKEGGSGFYKIIKIISVDLRCAINMDFRFLDENRFVIMIEIDAQELIV